MLTIAHRINTVAQLRCVPATQGVEIDLRDRGERLILAHDPFVDGEDFADWLRHYRHALLILNIKSERIEHRVLELMVKFNIANYFLLDCTLPMLRLLSAQGERRLAVRFSEIEPVESALALVGQVDWAWIDCFTRLPFDRGSYRALRAAFKLCLVSPELQGRPVETIAEFARQLAPYPVDAVCTKRPDLWHAAVGSALGRAA